MKAPGPSSRLARGFAIGLSSLAVLLAGCGRQETDTTAVSVPAEQLERVSLVLDGHVGPANVGIQIAEKRGFFEDVGIELWTSDAVIPGNPLPYLANYVDDFAISQEPQVVIAREKGVPVVAVGSMLSQPTAALIWLKRSRMRSLADLRGKSIGVPGVPFQKGLLKAMLARAGLTLEDVQVRRSNYNLVNALLHGTVDAIFGGSWNIEGAYLKAKGAEPVIRRAQSLGVPPYDEMVIVTREERLREEPESIRRLISAIARGMAVAERNPQVAAALIAKSGERSRVAGPKAIAAGLDATLPLLSGVAPLDLEKGRRLIAWMHRRGMIEGRPAAAKLLNNDYLPQP